VTSSKPENPKDRAKKEGLPSMVHRFYDSRYDAVSVKIFQGGHYITRDRNEMLVTVLGSCVAACIRDPDTGIGGMNHFMLPESATGDWQGVSVSMRYGNYAMEVLINEILATGCSREQLEIKVFGGASMVKGRKSIGHLNVAFVERYLELENLRIVAKDFGGEWPRRIHYYPGSGKVRMKILDQPVDTKLFKEESEIQSRISDYPVEGDVEIFE